jgi:hypothetical protein
MSFRNYDLSPVAVCRRVRLFRRGPHLGAWRAKYNYEVRTLMGILSSGEREAQDSLFKSSPHPHNPFTGATVIAAAISASRHACCCNAEPSSAPFSG